MNYNLEQLIEALMLIYQYANLSRGNASRELADVGIDACLAWNSCSCLSYIQVSFRTIFQVTWLNCFTRFI